ncbi:MAG: hypothetical protein FJ336_08355 [Sphingomonadales bacterium]|nr:hypothetical protein [Sphingomonadales bacterium]
MDYKDKYIKYKTKYLELKDMDINNQTGGNGNIDLDYINDMIQNLKEKSYSKNNILAFVLKKIMDKLGLTDKQYVIIAGYCLNKYKDVTDLDVIVQKGKPYNKLRNSGLFMIDTARISKDERLVLKLINIDENAEIEIFPKRKNIGFPSNYYSLENLQLENLLSYDNYGNPYFNELTCIKQYSDISKNDDGTFYMNTYKISRERVEKNISHLKNIFLNITDKKIKKYCKEKIFFLENLLL